MRNRYLRRHGRKKNPNTVSVILIIIILILLIIIVGVGRHNIMVKQREYDRKQAMLEEQIDEEKRRSEEIEEYGKYTKTKKFVEDMAKEKLGLVKDDEIVFKEGD